MADGSLCDDGDPCTGPDSCAAGQCTSKALDCNDADPCSVDYCKAGQDCVHAAIPKCGKVLPLPWADAFDCGGGSLWEISPAGSGPGWAIDASPAAPGYKSPQCSLNFNNGSNFNCPGGVSKVAGTASTLWLNALQLATGSGLKMTFQVAGEWESGSYDNLVVEAATDDATWKPLIDLDGVGTSWQGKTIDLAAYAGKLFRLRLNFNTSDCIGNSTSGGFVDDLYVGADVCTQDADCNDSKPCTQDSCDLASGKCSHKAIAAAGVCNDNNPCTTDGCDVTPGSPTLGSCAYKPDDGKSCDDVQLCTTSDQCSGGKCGGAAKCSDGGASAGRISSTGTATGLTLANLRFENNTNSDHGGALYIAGAKTKVRIVGCTFLGNYTNYLGGAIYMDKGSLWVLGTLFESNKTTPNNTQNGAAGLHALGVNAVLRDVVATGNSAAYSTSEFVYQDGGNFDGQRIRVVKQPSALYLVNCVNVSVDSLVSLTSWTPLQAVNTSGSLSLTNSLMQGADRNHVYLTGSGKATVTNVKWRGGKGTALQTGLDAVVSGIEISNWEAQNVGVWGAMFSCGYGSNDVVEVKNSAFRNIKADSGPVMFSGCGGGIDSCLFEGNSSLKDQGALVVFSSGLI